MLALLVLFATRIAPAALRALRRLRAAAEVDPPAILLALVVAGLPDRRQEWGQAMQAELDRIAGGSQRWRFSLGCGWAAAVIRARATVGSKEPGGQGLRVVVFSALGAAAALVGYGLVRYPGLRSDSHVWAAVVVFLALLCVYAAVTLALSRGVSSQATFSRRYGLLGGLLIGGAWLLALSPPEAFKSWVAFPLVIALFGPAGLAVVATQQSRDVTTGTRAALWSGLVGGLAVFIVWVTTTYADNGRPYDAGLVRDFHNSHAPDLTTYAVSDNLGSGLVLLLLIPTVALALGSLAARVASVSTRR